jgi:hypothetical protein
MVFGQNYPYYGLLLKREALEAFVCVCPNGETREVERSLGDRKGKKKGPWRARSRPRKKVPHIVTALRRV